MKQIISTLLLALAFVIPASSLDRQAFTVTSYQLDVQIDRPSQVMAVTGRLTLRNDSKLPQKNTALQISSALSWNGIAINNAPAEWIGNDYTSDIDHTGKLSEAIVNLPATVLPGGTISLDVQFGGKVTRDSTRLTRIGAPSELALRNDWDQISTNFTAIRGLGYVVWYPVSIPAVSMSDGNAVTDAIDSWKARHLQSAFEAHISVVDEDAHLCIVGNATASNCGSLSKTDDPRTGDTTNQVSNDVRLSSLGQTVPAFAVADYIPLERPALLLFHVRTREALAQDYASAAEANDTVLTEWLGPSTGRARVIELTDPNANPCQIGPVLFTPLRASQPATLQQLLIPVEVAARFTSPRPWIENGLQRFMQAVNIDRSNGRKSALQFLDEYRAPLLQASEPVQAGADSSSTSPGGEALLTTSDEIILRGKGSYLFWMLRDMLGDSALQKSLTSYHAVEDNEPAYFQKLTEQNGKRDLGWFFTDWVYQNHGLPDLRIDNVYARPQTDDPNRLYLVTVTVENLGGAGAEVPVSIQTPSGEKSIRLLVLAHQKASERTQLPAAPTRAIVNDGSVPEINTGNNTFDVPAVRRP